MPMRREKWGGLTCRVVDRLPTGRAPTLGVLLCHGFGAPGEDLVPLADVLYQLAPELAEGVQFVFPAAPLSLAEWGLMEGRAWWPLDLERLQAQFARQQFHEVRADRPAGLPAARDAVLGVLKDWCAASGLTVPRCVLGGFSQGAMTSVDVALHLPQSPAGLAVLSGALINELEWQSLGAQRSGLPVFQSHGNYDPLLPFVAGNWLRELLVEAGCQVQFESFDGGHEIPWEVLERLAAFLLERLTAVRSGAA